MHKPHGEKSQYIILVQFIPLVHVLWQTLINSRLALFLIDTNTVENQEITQKLGLKYYFHNIFI